VDLELLRSNPRVHTPLWTNCTQQIPNFGDLLIPVGNARHAKSLDDCGGGSSRTRGDWTSHPFERLEDVARTAAVLDVNVRGQYVGFDQCVTTLHVDTELNCH